MSQDEIPMLFPVGRMVQGSLYKPNTTDAQNRPLVVKTGPNAGQPRVDYFFAVAILKTPGVTHWAHEKSPDPNIGEWGAKLWAFICNAWPNGQYQRPDFAFKIIDGDSTIPNKQGKKPCDMVGHPGHWVVKFGGGYAPKIVTAKGDAVIADEGAVKPGHYVQVYASVSSNRSDQTPGIYINHRIVAHSGWGEEIISGPDPSSVGFGAAPLPPGASAVPLGGMMTPAAGTALPPAAPYAPPAAALPAPAGVPATPTPPASPVPAPAPNMGFVAGVTGAPAPAAAVPPPPAPAAAPPPPPPGRTMTAKAGGATYESFIGQGWNDDMLVQHGYMLP